MKKDQQPECFFSNLGRLLGYLDKLGVSALGVILIIGGIIGTMVLFDNEDRRDRPPMTGSGLAIAGCLISGALLQSSKRSK